MSEPVRNLFSGRFQSGLTQAGTAEQFRKKLKSRSSEKVMLAMAVKSNAATGENQDNSPATEISLLQKILDFLTNYKSDSGTPNFVVTERDSDGKVKSFKVEP